MADSTVKCKKFVSESEVEALRKKRQEEWEKVRKTEDPLGLFIFFLYFFSLFVLNSSSTTYCKF